MNGCKIEALSNRLPMLVRVLSKTPINETGDLGSLELQTNSSCKAVVGSMNMVPSIGTYLAKLKFVQAE